MDRGHFIPVFCRDPVYNGGVTNVATEALLEAIELDRTKRRYSRKGKQRWVPSKETA